MAGPQALVGQKPCARLFFAAAQNARLPERGTSGSVQRGPANPARPGREQRYRDCLGCRRSPEVPRAENAVRSGESKVSYDASRRVCNDEFCGSNSCCVFLGLHRACDVFLLA